MNENPMPYSIEPMPTLPTTPLAPMSPEPTGGMFERRIGRLGYFLGRIYLLAPVMVLMLIAFFLIPALGLDPVEGGIAATIVNTLLFILGIPLVIIAVIVPLSPEVRRVHDLGLRWPWILVGIIPLVNVVFALYLLFAPGQPGANQYGEPVTSLKFLDVLGFTKPE